MHLTGMKQYLLEKHSRLHHFDDLPGRRVLVVSPHPDDDVFGCGGTIARYGMEGVQVQVVCLCKGDKGIARLNGDAATQIRKNEFIMALEILGVDENNLFFMDFEDGGIPLNQESVDEFQEILQVVNPDIIYLPSFTDDHVDHFNANVLLKKCKLPKCLIAGYEIWTPHVPNRLVDVSEVYELKIQAMKEHKSQQEQLKYHDGIKALNRYRACLYPKLEIEYAESFFVLSSEAYFKLF